MSANAPAALLSLLSCGILLSVQHYAQRVFNLFRVLMPLRFCLCFNFAEKNGIKMLLVVAINSPFEPREFNIPHTAI